MKKVLSEIMILRNLKTSSLLCKFPPLSLGGLFSFVTPSIVVNFVLTLLNYFDEIVEVFYLSPLRKNRKKKNVTKLVTLLHVLYV